jgi:hypothetical protein
MRGKPTIVGIALIAAAILGASAGATSMKAPPWFAPIAAYYHHNPKVTPDYDFAALYSGKGATRVRVQR